jgi:aminoglycoside phosphotransferase (APT) family kinase protein
METPESEVVVERELVERLLRTQHPDLADLDLRFVANGWDNLIYRLGDDLAVRLPRRLLSAGLVEKEQRWMPLLAKALTVAIPVPLRVGVPGSGFPWSWSITRWLGGELAQVGASGPLLGDLARFLRELHTTAPLDAPRNPVRGVPLVDRNDAVLARLLTEPIPCGADVTRLWTASVAVKQWGGPAVWLHGDLHPSNLLTQSGRLAAVLDFGDLTAGDPATDLAVAWLLFDEDERIRFRGELDYDDATWQRARGWAIVFGSLAIGGDTAFRRFGEHALREVLVS